MKKILIPLGIFLLGMVAGGGLVFHFSPSFPFHHHDREMKHHLLDFLTARLNLTEEQRLKIAPILDQVSQRMEEERGKNEQAVFMIMHEADQEMAAQLTPAQQEALQLLENERDRTMQHFHPAPPPP